MRFPNKTARSLFAVGSALSILVLLAGCGGGDQDAEANHPAPAAADAPAHEIASATQAHAAGGTTVAGVTFTPPTSWQDVGPSGMRKAQYRFGPVEGDDAPAEVNVFYFGASSGGGVDANLQRWIGQMTLPDGADPQTAAARSEFTADGMAGHVIALDGTYKSGGMRPMGGGGEMMEDYRLVGVVLEGPQGSVFFKLTGPQKTAEAMEKDLMTMVEAAHK